MDDLIVRTTPSILKKGGSGCIRAAGEAGDWRALEAFLRISFPADYRRDARINVSATATAQQATAVIVTEEQRQRLIEMRERLLKAPSSEAETINVDPD
jgi:hypothetical protein